MNQVMYGMTYQLEGNLPAVRGTVATPQFDTISIEAHDLGNHGSGGGKVSEIKQIRIEFDCSKALAPEVLTVRFSDSATALVVILSMPGSRYPRTAAIGLGSPFLCGELLTPQTVATLGRQDTPRCQWADDSTLMIGLGAGASIRPQINKLSKQYGGDYVTFIDGVDSVSGVGFNCPSHIFKMRGEGARGLVFAPLTALIPIVSPPALSLAPSLPCPLSPLPSSPCLPVSNTAVSSHTHRPMRLSGEHQRALDGRAVRRVQPHIGGGWDRGEGPGVQLDSETRGGSL